MDFIGNYNLYLFIAGFALAVAELFVGINTGFDLLLIGLALVLGGVAGTLTNSFSVGLIVASITSIAYIIFGRKQIKTSLNAEAKPSNIDALIGKTAIVTKPIKPHHNGKVKVNNEIWLAKSSRNLKVGEKTKITQAVGVTLTVERL